MRVGDTVTATTFRKVAGNLVDVVLHTLEDHREVNKLTFVCSLSLHLSCELTLGFQVICDFVLQVQRESGAGAESEKVKLKLSIHVEAIDFDPEGSIITSDTAAYVKSELGTTGSTSSVHR